MRKSGFYPFLAGALLTGSAVLFAGAGAGGKEDDDSHEARTATQEIPTAVLAAVESAVPGATLKSAAREQEVAQEVYEVVLRTAAGKTMEAEILGDGTLLEIEEEVGVGDLPASVAAALEKVAPGGKIDEIERTMKVVYEIEKKIDGKEVEVAISASGKVIKMESGDDEEDEDDD
jgi:hypothetical protein